MTPVADVAASDSTLRQAAETQEVVHSTSVAVPAPEVVAQVPDSIPAPAPEPVQAVLHSAPVRSESPPVVEPVVEKVDLQQVLQSSGLQLVETRFNAEVVPEPTFVPAKRERRPPPTSMSEPLAQVETGKPVSAVPPA